jgi:hypothetical protein
MPMLSQSQFHQIWPRKSDGSGCGGFSKLGQPNPFTQQQPGELHLFMRQVGASPIRSFSIRFRQRPRFPIAHVVLEVAYFSQTKTIGLSAFCFVTCRPLEIDNRTLTDSQQAVVTYHNPLDNVTDLAHHFFSRCLKAGDPFVGGWAARSICRILCLMPNPIFDAPSYV